MRGLVSSIVVLNFGIELPTWDCSQTAGQTAMRRDKDVDVETIERPEGERLRQGRKLMVGIAYERI